MLGFLCKRFANSLTYGRSECFSSNEMLLLRSTYFTKSFSTDTNKVDKQAFVVSYLINSCGMPPETATSVCKKVQFGTLENPSLVVNLLKDHGFTNTHISKLVGIRPEILLYNAQKTLLPKIEFFYSMGIASSDLVEIISSCPNLLLRSLKSQLVPCYDFLKNVILLDDKKIASALKNLSWFFQTDLEKNIVPKIQILKHLGVPTSSFPNLVTRYPIVLLRSYERFKKDVKEIVEMGFDPSTSKFVIGLYCIVSASKLAWERKKEVYKRCGWSEDEIQLAFRRYPQCMKTSEEKIVSVMDLLVNRMGWKAADIARYPSVVLFSLQKRTIPRCLVIEALVSKGLIKKHMCLSTVFVATERDFSSRFITKYQKDFPELLDVFHGKVSLPDLASASTELLGMKQ